MRKALKKKYLLDHYRQDAFLKFHNFRQNDLSVEEYTAEFDHSMMRCDIVEPEEQMVARYLGGLRLKISNIVKLQPYWTYNDGCKLTLKVEKQLKEGRRSTYRPFNRDGSTNQGGSSTSKATPPTKTAAVKNETPSGSNRFNTPNSSRKCFKCHGFGHIASDCPNRKIISLVEEELEGNAEEEQVEEESEEELTYADQGESLVMEIKAPLQRISFKYQLGRLREHEQRNSRMYSMDSSKSYGLKQIRGGPLSMIHVGNKESSP